MRNTSKFPSPPKEAVSEMIKKKLLSRESHSTHPPPPTQPSRNARPAFLFLSSKLMYLLQPLYLCVRWGSECSLTESTNIHYHEGRQVWELNLYNQSRDLNKVNTHTQEKKIKTCWVSSVVDIHFFECRTVICTGKTDAPHSNWASIAELWSLQGCRHGSNTFPLMRDCLFCAVT